MSKKTKTTKKLQKTDQKPTKIYTYSMKTAKGVFGIK